MKQYSIDEAAMFLGVDAHYVRKLVREGKLEAEWAPVKPGSQVMKHLISEEQLVARKSKQGQHAGSRADGRSKWVVYATDAEMKKLAAVAAEMGLPAPVKPNEGMYQRRLAKEAAK